VCNVTAHAGRTRSIPRPQWGRLYVQVSSVLAALAVVERIVAPGLFETALECGLVAAGIGAIVLWTRRNCVALDRQDWCDCAGAKVTVRVIPSRRPGPSRTEHADEPTPVEAVLEEVGR
jgi:hypothetical protein